MNIISNEQLFLIQGSFYVENYDDRFIFFTETLNQEILKPIHMYQPTKDSYTRVVSKNEILFLATASFFKVDIINRTALDFYLPKSIFDALIKFLNDNNYKHE